jgi:hypothetical protein
MSLLISPVVIVALAQATVQVPVAPPSAPPVVRAVPPSPPIVISPPEPERGPRFDRFRVEILGDHDVLWTGEIAASDQQQTSFTQSLRQPSKACPDQTWVNMGSTRDELRLNVAMPRERRTATFDPNQVAVEVTWQRALPACGGQATVGFERSVSVATGETETIVGDAGLTIRLTRLGPAK